MIMRCDCACKLGGWAEAWVSGPGPLVFTDIDNTMRWDKDPILPENEQAIQKFQKKGGTLIAVTGAPLWHIPRILRRTLAFGESGGVLAFPDDRIITLVPDEGLSAMWELRRYLGIDVSAGMFQINGEKVIVEGPRYSSLTLASGDHPDYPDDKGTISIDTLDEQVQMIIEECQFPLVANKGKVKNYEWIDVTARFEKHHAVTCFMGSVDRKEAYFLGDGLNDLEAMEDDSIIPVGFSNSVPQVQEIARKKGILINQDGPDGGAAQALSTIMGSSF